MNISNPVCCFDYLMTENNKRNGSNPNPGKLEIRISEYRNRFIRFECGDIKMARYLKKMMNAQYFLTERVRQ